MTSIPLVSGTDAQVAWVLRRIGFGATSSDLERASTLGFDAWLDELFDPGAAGVPDDGDPWATVAVAERTENRRDVVVAAGAWVDRLVDHRRPVTEWLAWYWHGHLVSSLAVVRSPAAMVDQIRLFRALGAGPFGGLLRAVTVDRAMLRYLDGATSSGANPNENYSRELLELFALGVGRYTEADVQAGARALTGWTVRPGAASASFVPARHDDTPQRYLGVEGVHDVDTVIAAVTAHPECAAFVARRLAVSVLGPGVAADVATSLAPSFAADGLVVGPLVRRMVEFGLDGRSEPIVPAPVPWLVGAVRATGARLDARVTTRLLRAAGQIPLMPPTVAGWPPGDEWLSSSSTIARLDAAIEVAESADPAGTVMDAAERGDLDGLAWALGRPDGFRRTSIDALRTYGTTPKRVVALALCTPELVIA